jgi:hypothetical protein
MVVKTTNNILKLNKKEKVKSFSSGDQNIKPY